MQVGIIKGPSQPRRITITSSINGRPCLIYNRFLPGSDMHMSLQDIISSTLSEAYERRHKHPHRGATNTAAYPPLQSTSLCPALSLRHSVDHFTGQQASQFALLQFSARQVISCVLQTLKKAFWAAPRRDGKNF